MSKFIGVSRRVVTADDRVIERGAYKIGDGISKEDAESITSVPEWGREIEEREAGLFGGLREGREGQAATTRDIPGNKFVAAAGVNAPPGFKGAPKAEKGVAAEALDKASPEKASGAESDSKSGGSGAKK